jgi:cell division transport system permease protein
VRAVDYALRQAWLSLLRARSGSLLAIAAIALAIVVLGALLLLTWNAEHVLSQWTSAAELSIYLRDDASSEQRGAIESLLERSGVVRGHQYVSKTEAQARFRRQFLELAKVTEEFSDNPFPASIEVQLRPEAEQGGRADALVREVAPLAGVSDIRYDREWLAAFARAVRTVRGAGFALGALMALAAAATVAAVVRLGLTARRDEIEIMQLVGAPLVFIRGPFVAEGLLQGGFGALVAVVLLWLGYVVARGWWAADLAASLGGATVTFLPIRLCLYLVAGGMIVGAAGGFAAARHAG